MERNRQNLSSEYQQRRELRQKRTQKAQRSLRIDWLSVMATLYALLAAFVRGVVWLAGALVSLVRQGNARTRRKSHASLSLFQPGFNGQGLTFTRSKFYSPRGGSFGNQSLASSFLSAAFSSFVGLVSLAVRFRYIVLVGLVLTCAYISVNALWGGASKCS